MLGSATSRHLHHDTDTITIRSGRALLGASFGVPASLWCAGSF